jgi:4-amino-4-deoxy-L-arabinose transferase-like glycosyltransferase
MLRVTRRAALVWLLLFGVYAGTLGLRAFDRSAYAGDEPRYLLSARSLAEDGNLNVFDEYRQKAYRGFFPYVLKPRGTEDAEQATLYDPVGAGFPLLITPAYKLGGAHLVELFLAALAALAVALAYLLALRVTPDPWALGATLTVGLSPPLLAYGTAVYPDMAVAACLCGAALLALSAADLPTRPRVFGSFFLLALVPWLGARFVAAALVIVIFLVIRLRAQRRGLMAILGCEVVGFSVALYIALNEGLYGGITPYSAEPPGTTPTGANSASDYGRRVDRLVGLLGDRHYGLFCWAPILFLALVGAWLLWRGRRERLGQALPGYRAIASAAGLCLAVVGAQFLVAVFLAPTLRGFWFPGLHLVAVLPIAIPLVALGLRHLPRLGVVLGALGVAASVWLYLAVRIGDFGLASDRPDVPRVIGVLGLLALAAAAAARIPRFQTFTWGGARGRRQGHS